MRCSQRRILLAFPLTTAIAHNGLLAMGPQFRGLAAARIACGARVGFDDHPAVDPNRAGAGGGGERVRRLLRPCQVHVAGQEHLVGCSHVPGMAHRLGAEPAGTMRQPLTYAEASGGGSLGAASGGTAGSSGEQH